MGLEVSPIKSNNIIGIQIFGERELAGHIRAGKGVMSHCISIRNSHEDMPDLLDEIAKGFTSILHLEFYDVEKRDWLPEEFRNRRIPELKDVVMVLQYAARATLDPGFTGFTIHCWRGKSRSSAIALGIIHLILKNEERAAQYLGKIRPGALPLPRIVNFWDQILGSNLKLEIGLIRARAYAHLKAYVLGEIADMKHSIPSPSDRYIA